MANVPNSYGVGEVSPSARPPDDYNRPDVRVGAFGGHIAAGEEALGKGLTQAGKFFGQVVVNDGANYYEKEASKILYGDPNVIGPDGKPDVGYFGLKGEAAMRQRPIVEKQLDDLLKKTRDNLTTIEQQLEFDSITRRHRNYLSAGIGNHADAQTNSWFSEVNSDTAKIKLNAISQNPEDDNNFKNANADLRGAYVRLAQDKYGAQLDSKVVESAIADADRDAMTARVNAIGAKNPALAAEMVEKNKAVLGTHYLHMSNEFRARADQQRGDEGAARALPAAAGVRAFAQPVEDAITKAAQATGEDVQALRREAMIESSGDPNWVKGSFRGLFQMSQAEFAKYGPAGGNIFNPDDNAMAAANKRKAEKAEFQAQYGRPATNADLYLIHQQGRGGYAAHVANPDGVAWRNMLSTGEGRAIAEGRQKYNGATGAAAAEAWAKAAIWGNVPDQVKGQFGSVDNVTSRDFTSYWAQRVNGGGALVMEATKAQRQAAAYKLAMDDPVLKDNPRAMQHALTVINQRITAETIAQEHSDKARKDAADVAADGYVKRMLNGGDMAGMVNEIANDHAFDHYPHIRQALAEAALKDAGNDETLNARRYGPGYYSAYKAILADSGDPQKITDPMQLYQRAGQGGDLTLAGAAELVKIMRDSAKNYDEHGVQTTKLGMMNYAKSKLSFEQDTGPIKIRDPKGEAIFNAQFLPKFNAALDEWRKAGKNPYEFLTRENMDKFIAGMRNQAEMRLEKMRAEGIVPDTEQDQKNLPPPPEGVNADNWNAVMAMRPQTENGTRFSAARWGEAINLLRSDPSPEMIKTFNESAFGKAGYKAEDILKRLQGEPQKPGMFDRLGRAVSRGVQSFIEGEAEKKRRADEQSAVAAGR